MHRPLRQQTRDHVEADDVLRNMLRRRAQFGRCPLGQDRASNSPLGIGQGGPCRMKTIKPIAAGKVELCRLFPTRTPGLCYATGSGKESPVFRHFSLRSAFFPGHVRGSLELAVELDAQPVAACRVWMSTPTIDTLVQLTNMRPPQSSSGAIQLCRRADLSGLRFLAFPKANAANWTILAPQLAIKRGSVPSGKGGGL